jgi:aspartate/methionine/tyrosine aminotransferase
VDEDGYVAERIREYIKLRDMALDRFAATDLIEVEPARGTTYLFMRCLAAIPDQTLACAENAGQPRQSGYQFGPRGLGCFRVYFAQDEAAWRSALDRIVSR